MQHRKVVFDNVAELIGDELAKVSALFDAHIDYDYLFLVF